MAIQVEISKLTHIHLEVLRDHFADTCQTEVSIWGTRKVTINGQSITLDTLTQKIAKISGEHLSSQARDTAHLLLLNIATFLETTNRQIAEKSLLDKAITKFFLFFRETVIGYFSPGLWNQEYWRTLHDGFRVYSNEEAFRREFNVPGNLPINESRAYEGPGPNGTIYAGQYAIFNKAIDEERLEQEANERLADEIIAARPDDFLVRDLCSSRDFFKNPTFALIHSLITEGVNRSPNDEPRAFVISKIPGFFDTVTSLEYLKAFAEIYLQNESPTCKAIFEKSFESREFVQSLLKTNIARFAGNSEDAEYKLRIALDIFRQTKEGKIYEAPRDPRFEALIAAARIEK